MRMETSGAKVESRQAAAAKSRGDKGERNGQSFLRKPARPAIATTNPSEQSVRGTAAEA